MAATQLLSRDDTVVDVEDALDDDGGIGSGGGGNPPPPVRSLATLPHDSSCSQASRKSRNHLTLHTSHTHRCWRIFCPVAAAVDGGQEALAAIDDDDDDDEPSTMTTTQFLLMLLLFIPVICAQGGLPAHSRQNSPAFLSFKCYYRPLASWP